MPDDLTGSSLANIYTSFLHVSSDFITSSFEQVFDGQGNKVPMYVSTRGVSLSGNVSINNMSFPESVGNPNQIISVNSSGNLQYRTVIDVLTSSSVSTVVDGTYSSPKITMLNGFINALADNPTVKTFFTRTANITPQNLILIPQLNWPNPVVNDIAYVMNLADNKAYKISYSAFGWNLTESI